MTFPAVRETPIPGPLPRFELPGWRERYGAVAGITGRGDGPGRGFDLGLWTDAPVGEIMGRWRAFRAAQPGFSGFVLGNQVHQTAVATQPSVAGWLIQDGMDGHVTGAAGLLLLVTVADCIPVYLLDPVRRVAGLLHAGWRGTAAGIMDIGVGRMREEFGCSPASIVMHCGIGICGQCYEVGSEVVSGCGLRVEGGGPWHVDLRERLLEQGRSLGLETMSTSQWCSAHHRPLFASHRASRGADGRMVAYLGFPLPVGGPGA